MSSAKRPPGVPSPASAWNDCGKLRGAPAIGKPSVGQACFLTPNGNAGFALGEGKANFLGERFFGICGACCGHKFQARRMPSKREMSRIK